MGRCFVCEPPRNLPDGDFHEHMLVAHGIDVEAEVQRWSDGQPVIVDKTLEPEDFDGP